MPPSNNGASPCVLCWGISPSTSPARKTSTRCTRSRARGRLLGRGMRGSRERSGPKPQRSRWVWETRATVAPRQLAGGRWPSKGRLVPTVPGHLDRRREQAPVLGARRALGRSRQARSRVARAGVRPCGPTPVPSLPAQAALRRARDPRPRSLPVRGRGGARAPGRWRAGPGLRGLLAPQPRWGSRPRLARAGAGGLPAPRAPRGGGET